MLNYENSSLRFYFYWSWSSILLCAGCVWFIPAVTDGSIAVAWLPDLQTDVTYLVFPSEVPSTDHDALWCDVTTALITECCTPASTKLYFLTAGILQRSDDFLQSLDVKMDMLRFKATVSNPGSNTDLADVLQEVDHCSGARWAQFYPLERHVEASLPAGAVWVVSAMVLFGCPERLEMKLINDI